MTVTVTRGTFTFEGRRYAPGDRFDLDSVEPYKRDALRRLYGLTETAESGPVRCAGVKSDGTSCRAWPVDGSDFCTNHTPEPETVEGDG